MKTRIYSNSDLYGSSLVLVYFSKKRFPGLGDEMRYFVTQAQFYKFVEGYTIGETDKQLKIALISEIKKFNAYTKEPIPEDLVDWLIINYINLLGVIDGHKELL